MRVGFLVDKFPAKTQTFILNQMAGLIDQDVELTIVSRADRESRSELTHGVVDAYDLLERTSYSSRPGTYRGGLTTLGRSLAGIARNDRVSLQAAGAAFALDKHYPHRLANVRTVAEQGEQDVYHAHFGHVGNSFLDVTDLWECPYVASFYGFDASSALRADPNRYDRLFEQVDAITVLSEDMRSDLTDVGCPASKTHIQPLCVDVEQFPYEQREHTGDEPFRLLTVARFVEKKGLEYALKAVAELDREYDITYRIAGDGDRRDRIERLIEDLGLGDTVELLGWQEQSAIVEEMHDAHAFVLPSVTAENGNKEGTPTVLLEAQATGLPVVSTYHAGIPEIVGDDTTGLLVPERDVDALAEAIETVITDEDSRQEMGKRGRERIESTHAKEVVSSDLVDLYRSVQ